MVFNAHPGVRFPGNQCGASGFLFMSRTSPFRPTKWGRDFYGRHFHCSGITVNKKAQTAESAKAGGPLRIDDAFPLNDGGSFRVEAKEVPASETADDELWYKD